jgi:RNA polymerase sigma factor (sigma-70 family)
MIVNSTTPDPLPSASQDRWFEEELQPLEPSLRAFLQHRYPNLADTDDVVQESFLKVLFARQMGKLTSVKGLLFTVARNSAVSIFRKGRRISAIPVNEMADASVLQDETNLVETVCRRDELDMVIEAIARLPGRCREIVALRLVLGLSDGAIADKLGISEQTVRVQMARGVRKCAERLRKRGIVGRQEL